MAAEWNAFLLEEFEKESDRASALLVGAVLDEILKSALHKLLVPAPASYDDFLDGSSAVINTLGSRIDLIYRMGYISSRLCSDLHLIRKIRDDFAHDVTGNTYDKPSIKDRIQLLYEGCGTAVQNELGNKIFDNTTRGKFLLSASWRLWHLDDLDANKIDAAELEWGYTYTKEEAEKDEKSENKVSSKGKK